MDKKKKILIAIGSLAALYGLALLIFWIVVKIEEKKHDDEAPVPKGGEAEEQAVGSGSKWPNFPLKWGSGTSRNLNQQQVKNYVRGIQNMCSAWSGSNLALDGIWGDKTEAAIQQLATVDHVYHPKNERSITPAPFARCIAQVQNPVSEQSKKQIFLARYNEMVAWHNKYYKEMVAWRNEYYNKYQHMS